MYTYITMHVEMYIHASSYNTFIVPLRVENAWLAWLACICIHSFMHGTKSIYIYMRIIHIHIYIYMQV